mmetsp:Transcript_38883/g.62606  ORF Transcript_38883/g.62606 Transcript_38883/m.62606 type:complete len:544 (+) Transcript_38883:199-1830(+)
MDDRRLLSRGNRGGGDFEETHHQRVSYVSDSADLPPSPLAAASDYVELLEEESADRDAAAGEDSTWLVKYKASYIALGIISLSDSIEYGVIMPSLFQYLNRLDSGSHSDTELNHFYGLILSSFSAASLVSKPLLGYLADRRPYLETFIWSTVIAVMGNILYFMTEYICSNEAHGANFAFSLLLAARVLCGVGCANTALTFAFVARTAPPHQRTRYMTLFSMSKVAGFALGPGLNAITGMMKFSVGNLHVNEFNAPGLFVALVQILIIFYVMIVLEEPPPYSDRERAESSLSESKGTIMGTLKHCSIPLTMCFVNILFYNFFIGSVEAFIVPVTSFAFHWNSLHNSYVYLGITAVSISVSIFVMKASGKIEDRTFLLSAAILAVFSTTIVHFTYWYDMSTSAFWFGVLCWCVPISLAFPTNRSLFSRLVAESHYQALLSSMLSVFASLGSLLGPYWVGLTLGTRPTGEDHHYRVAPVAIYGCIAGAAVVAAMNVYSLFLVKTDLPILAHQSAVFDSVVDGNRGVDSDEEYDYGEEESSLRIVSA